MTSILARRQFLAGSLATACTAVNGHSLFGTLPAGAATLNVPEVDRLTVSVLLDSSHDIFLAPQQVAGIQMQRARPAAFPENLCTISGGYRCFWNRSGPIRHAP